MYRIPIYRVKLVRDGSQAVERERVVSPVTAANLLHQYLDGANREHFVVLLLDTHHQIIGIHTVTIGTLDASLIHPREVFPKEPGRVQVEGLVVELGRHVRIW